jgi:hypothetical protein
MSLTGPTQISSSTANALGIQKIDSSNFVVFRVDNTASTLYAHSVNWNGTDTISENSNVDTGYDLYDPGIGTVYLSCITLNDDGTYIWYAVFGVPYGNGPGNISTVKVNKSTLAPTAGGFAESLSKYTPRSQAYSGKALVYLNNHILVMYSATADPYSAEMVFDLFEWDSTTPEAVYVASFINSDSSGDLSVSNGALTLVDGSPFFVSKLATSSYPYTQRLEVFI